MVVRAALNQKKRENKKIAPFLLVPVGQLALDMANTLLLYNSTHANRKTDTYQWISAGKHTKHVKLTLQRLIGSSISFISGP